MPCRDRGASGARASCCSRSSLAWRRLRTLWRCPWPRCWAWRPCSGSPRGTGARCCPWCWWPRRGPGAGLCLLRLLARRLQLCLPLGGGIPVVLARSGPALLLARFPTPASPWPLRRAGPVSWRAQVALLRQHRSAACALHFDGARDDGALRAARGSGRSRFCSRLWAASLPTPTTAHGPLALGAAGAIVLLQAVLCVLSLPGLMSQWQQNLSNPSRGLEKPQNIRLQKQPPDNAFPGAKTELRCRSNGRSGGALLKSLHKFKQNKDLFPHFFPPC
jgi:hypothetical protein